MNKVLSTAICVSLGLCAFVGSAQGAFTYGLRGVEILGESTHVTGSLRVDWPAYGFSFDDSYADPANGQLTATLIWEGFPYVSTVLSSAEAGLVYASLSSWGGPGGESPDLMDARASYSLTFRPQNPVLLFAWRAGGGEPMGSFASVEIVDLDTTERLFLWDTVSSEGPYGEFGVNPLHIYSLSLYAGSTNSPDNFAMAEIDLLHTVPAPGALVLCTIGSGLVGWMRRRRA